MYVSTVIHVEESLCDTADDSNIHRSFVWYRVVGVAELYILYLLISIASRKSRFEIWVLG